MAVIQIKRGVQAGIEHLVLAQGEMAVALDTGNVYVGTTAGKVLVNPSGGTADEAVRLKAAREFAVSGDATAPAVGFDGTQNVNLVLALAAMPGLTAGTYTKLTVDAKGRVTAGTTIAVDDLPSIPSTKVTGLPSKVSELQNDAAYQTAAQVAAKVTALVNAAPETLDTLKELADALGNDPNFSATLAGQIGSKVDKVSGKGLSENDYTAAEKTKLAGLSNYVHPAAGAKVSGLYKITVDATGHVSAAVAVSKADITGLGIPAQDTTYAAATASVNGLMLAADKSKLDAVAAGANNYALPMATASVLGGVKAGDGLVVAAGVLSLGDVDGGAF